MPPTDYATMRQPTAVPSKEEHNADLVLTQLADTRLMAPSRPGGMITMFVFLASMITTGLWIRSITTPNSQEIAGACILLLIVAVAIPHIVQAERKNDPQWARAAAVHQKSLTSRAPAATLALVKERMAKMTISTGWRAAFLHVSPCTEEDTRSPHHGPCCAGATWVRGGRLLVILGSTGTPLPFLAAAALLLGITAALCAAAARTAVRRDIT
jgi:hypothetical protein